MRVLVTGASGFVGRVVVRQCIDAGHDVIALVRPTANLKDLGESDRLTVVRGDLRQRGEWCDQIGGAEVVIHLAAATNGDLGQQFNGTVIATENLLACRPSSIRRFVHVSSFSVYNYAAIGSGHVLDEASPLETRPQDRDAYTWTKLIQERMVVKHCDDTGLACVVIRPGAIYGPGKDWDIGRALKIGSFDLIFAPLAQVRLIHVENCAEAIIMAATSPAAAGRTFNLVDDDLPSNATYHSLCKAAGGEAGRATYVPWWLIAATGMIVRFFNRAFLRSRARLPELLEYRRQQARWKPLIYSNRRAKEELAWLPRLSIRDGVAGAIEEKRGA